MATRCLCCGELDVYVVAKYDEGVGKGGYCWHLRRHVRLRLHVCLHLRRASRRNLCEQGKRVQENTHVNKSSLQRLKVTKQVTAKVTTAVLTEEAKQKSWYTHLLILIPETPWQGTQAQGRQAT